MLGGMPPKNAQVDPGGTGRHVVREQLLRARARGARFVLLSPLREDALPEFDAEWLPLRPSTDAAPLLGLAHTLVAEGLHDCAFLDRCTVGFDRPRPTSSAARTGRRRTRTGRPRSPASRRGASARSRARRRPGRPWSR